ncbi:uncharacterized protein N7459_009326 [Penicillium hispanicum]|uniref:uncharacterized protein n=1 Tax=Penicillium hispanicum TaxID=1080232 RepID=UPI00253F6A8B|nr:uncharacterized protein N7459_009326 [Penicillium hispanicum]KAJ5569896.1 hypothetical protein N7459_009326 [Penicillium hispanicum]
MAEPSSGRTSRRQSVLSILSCCCPSGSDEEAQQPPIELEPQPLKYGDLQRVGAARRRWLENPNEPGCFIPRSTLMLNNFLANHPLLENQARNIPEVLRGHVIELGLPNEFDTNVQQSVYRHFTVTDNEIIWVGCTGPGVIVISDMNRPEGSTAPPIAQVSQAFYERDFDLGLLKVVFMLYVVNDETLEFIRETLYTQLNNISWPGGGRRSWDFGTPEYDALLGTRLGKLAAYLLLGAFNRGTRRISRIITWPNRPVKKAAVHLRFDIETIG